ncbi:MAG: hypothetical protein OXH22_02725 [Chloroflexi bacterium]|nr:hypothetical protein [Chloroflexota bacterium]
MLEVLGRLFLIFLGVGPYIVGSLPPIIAGVILIRRGNREENSIVAAIGTALLAIGTAVGLMAIMLSFSLIIPTL